MHRYYTLATVAVLLVAGIDVAAGQPQGQQQASPPPRAQQQQQTPARDQDRMHDMQRDRDRLDADMQRDRDQLRDRDRIHQDERTLFGHSLMTEEERIRFRSEMQAATSAAERQRIAERHRAEIQQRAQDRGVDLQGRPVFGWQMMSAQERSQFMERAQQMEQDRTGFLEQHRERMLERARQRNIPAEELETDTD